MVITELLGLPAEDRKRFVSYGRRLTTTNILGLFSAIPNLLRLQNYLTRQFQLRRQTPGPGLISAMVQAEQMGDRLNEEELLATAFLLLLAGHETTVHLIGCSVLALIESPTDKDKLLGDWRLVNSTVEEVLRYMSPVEFAKPRLASQDVERHGQQIGRGDFVIGMLAAANHDPAHFPDPHRFDIQRHPNAHLSFGTGIHVCLGLKLARAEAQIALQQLFSRFPNMELSVPATRLAWTRRLGIRGPAALPVTLEA
jgi:cytochrome P450